VKANSLQFKIQNSKSKIRNVGINQGKQEKLHRADAADGRRAIAAGLSYRFNF
jgi:hypothetical protein